MSRASAVLWAALLMPLLLIPAPVAAQAGRPMTVDDVLGRRLIGAPAISPDGRQVAYVVNQRDLERSLSDSDIWLASVEGGSPVRVAQSDKSDDDPQWAPDGSWLAFRSSRAGRAQIYGIRPAGGEAWQVSDWPQGVGQFRISPNGKWIAFTSSAAPTEADKALEKIRGRPIVWDSSYTDQWTRLWAAPIEGRKLGKVIQVSPDTLHVDAGYFEWAPDSRGLAFCANPSPFTVLTVQVFVADAPGAATRRVTKMGGGAQPVSWTEAAGLLVRSTDSESPRPTSRCSGSPWTVVLRSPSRRGSMINRVSSGPRPIGCT